MKTIALILTALAALSNFAAATDRKCTNDVLYCGKTLLNSKWSHSSIQAACTLWAGNNGVVPSDAQIDQSLFKCGGSGNNLVWINGQTPCANCIDGGSGKCDYCG